MKGRSVAVSGNSVWSASRSAGRSQQCISSSGFPGARSKTRIVVSFGSGEYGDLGGDADDISLIALLCFASSFQPEGNGSLVSVRTDFNAIP